MITSLDNKYIKLAKKLQQKKYRKQESLFYIEGEHLVQEALYSNLLSHVFHTTKYEVEDDALWKENICVLDGLSGVIFEEVSDEIMQKVKLTDTPQGIFAIAKIPMTNLAQTEQKIIVLDGVQDPGNVGTIIRTAVAFGSTTILMTNDTVDPYNDKVLRAHQGMGFTVPIISGTASELCEIMNDFNCTNFVLDFEGTSIKEIDKNEFNSFALIVGQEGQGIRPENWKTLTPREITIPMHENAESLNVAIATAIAMYELF